MAQVDTSVYNIPAPQPVNPLALYAQALSIKNAQNTNALGNQEVAGNNALAQSYVRNPDGSINFPASINKLQGSGAAYRMHDLLSQQLAANQPQEYFDGKQVVRVPAQNFGGIMNPAGNNPNAGQSPQPQLPPKSLDDVNAIHDHFGSVADTLQSLNEKPDLSQSDVLGATSDMVSDNRMSAPHAAKALMAIPNGPNGAPPTPQQLKQYVAQSLASLQKSHQQFTQAYGPPSQKNQSSGSGAAGGNDNLPPMGVAAGPTLGQPEAVGNSMKNAKDVYDEAKAVPQQNALLDNISDLSQSGAPTGTIKAKWAQWLAAHGIAPAGVDKNASDAQVISKYMEQALLASGMPSSDARLQAVESANPNPDQLPETIQRIVPFLKAVNQGKLAKANFYQSHVGLGQDPNQELSAGQLWNNHFDPRLMEMQQLSKDPTALKEFIKTLQPNDKADLLKKYRASKQFGILPQQ